MAIAKPRYLTPDEIRDLLALNKEDIDLHMMRDMFACKIGQAAPKFNTYDKFRLPAKRLYNEDSIETTIGRYIVNLVVLPPSYLKKYGYVNYTLSKKTIGNIEDQLGVMVLMDEMSTEEYTEFLDRGEWLGMGCDFFLSPTMDYDVNNPIPEVIELRDKLFEKYKTEIKKGDKDVANMIEQEILKLAKVKAKEKQNECFDYYDAGVGSFDNNYKKTSIMGGALENPYTKKIDILKSNYIDGVDIKEYPVMTNLTLVGGYSRRRRNSGFAAIRRKR